MSGGIRTRTGQRHRPIVFTRVAAGHFESTAGFTGSPVFSTWGVERHAGDNDEYGRGLVHEGIDCLPSAI